MMELLTIPIVALIAGGMDALIIQRHYPALPTEAKLLLMLGSGIAAALLGPAFRLIACVFARSSGPVPVKEVWSSKEVTRAASKEVTRPAAAGKLASAAEAEALYAAAEAADARKRGSLSDSSWLDPAPPLIFAARRGDRYTVGERLAAGDAVNAKDSQGNTVRGPRPIVA